MICVILIGRENTLFCFPLTSFPRNRESNIIICKKKTILWISGFVGMTPINMRRGILKLGYRLNFDVMFIPPFLTQEPEVREDYGQGDQEQ
jgi:hypothetical protein